jgi:hypothetical protein
MIDWTETRHFTRHLLPFLHDKTESKQNARRILSDLLEFDTVTYKESIWTHYGLVNDTSLVSRVDSAPDVFQRCFKNVNTSLDFQMS